MKLVSLFCVAALSLVGCAEEITPTGGMGEGVYPYKVSEQKFEQLQKEFEPGDVTKYQGKYLGDAPADSVCEGCVMDSYRVLDTSSGIDEVRVVSDGRMELCRIFLDQGTIVLDECGSYHR